MTLPAARAASSTASGTTPSCKRHQQPARIAPRPPRRRARQQPLLVAVALDLDAHAPPLGAAVAQLLHPAGRHQASVLDDRHRLADALHELELVRGEDHRHASGRVLGEHARQHVHADGIEAGERLVEHEQLGIVHHRRGQLHALLVAERELLDAISGAVAQAEAIDPALGRGHRRGGPDAVQPGEVHELVAHAHLRVQPALLRHVAEPRTGFEVDRPAVEEHLAAIRREHAEHDPHRRGLSGAVWTDEPEHLPRLDTERDPVQRDDVAVPPGEVPQFQHYPSDYPTSAGSSRPWSRSRPRCTAAMNFERLTSSVLRISSA